MFGSVKMSEYEGFSGWTIRLKRPFIPDDAVFLAHVWHDRCTEGRAKSIYARLESGIPSGPHSLPWKSFVKVCPWFEGPAELLVRGFWFDDERDRKFLALRVDGCSDPEGVPVGYVHGGTRDSSSGAAVEGNRARLFKKRRVSDKVRLTDRVPPDRGSPSIRLEDPLFEVLGKRRVVEQLGEPGLKGPVRSLKGKGNGPGQYSDSDQYSTGKDVGQVSLAARVDRRSGDVLSDMWETLLYLQEKRSDVVSSVVWVALDQDSRFQHRQEGPPQLILLESFTLKEEDALPTGVRNWLWLDPDRSESRAERPAYHALYS